MSSGITEETSNCYGENSRRRFEEMFTADHMIDAYVNSTLHCWKANPERCYPAVAAGGQCVNADSSDYQSLPEIQP